MKKYLVITLTCLIASFLIFGNFNALQSSSENSAALLKAWEDAEKAIKTANDTMHKLDMKLVKYKTEYKTIQGTGISLASTMWNPWDIVKGLFTNSHPMVRLLTVGADIAFVYGQIDELNGILKKRETTRDNALTAYNNSTSQKRTKKHDPEYRDIPEVSIPCENYCGVVFSSKDVGFQNLGHAAEWKHKTTCSTSATPKGCGDSYYTCNGKQNGIKEAERHKPRTCGKMYKYKSAHNGKILSEKCGRQFRNCKNPLFLHNAYLSGTVFGIPTRHAEKGDSSDTTAAIIPGFSPSSGSYTASAGDTHTGKVTAPSIYGAYFYVNGTSQGWFGGSQSTTSLSFSYTFPSSASGSYTMKALVYPWSGSSYGSPATYSYTVTVGSTTTTTTTTTPTSTPSTSTQTDDDDDDDTDSDSDSDDDDDDSSSGNSIGPASGYSDTGKAGLSYAVKLTSSGAFSQVKWYVMGPGDASASLWSTNDYYDGMTSESTFYHYFYENISGDYVFTAEVKPLSGDSYSTSFTVSVTAD